MKRTTILLYVFIGILFFSCNDKPAGNETKKTFCLPDSLQKKIPVEEVKLTTAKSEVLLSGKIEANEDKLVKVYPVVGGVVADLRVQLGDYVKKGQLLAIVRSSEIADYQGQLSFAASNVKIAEKNVTTNQELRKAGLATDKDVLSAETDLEKAKADLKRFQQTNAIYGSAENATQEITAPVSGYIIQKNITDNMQYRADAALPFFVIANLDEVWVMADVFESDIAKIKTGYEAQVSVVAYKEKTFTGKVDRIFPILDPQSRVMKVRIKISNSDNLLKPEMFAQINIRYDDENNKLPSIPASAVIFDKNKNFVIVFNDSCNIETREIEIYKTVGNTTYINSGLKEGEKIITGYQLLVYDTLND